MNKKRESEIDASKTIGRMNGAIFNVQDKMFSYISPLNR